MDELVNIKKTANNMAAGRVSALGNGPRFKVTHTVLREELVTACMYGELSAMERLLVCLQNGNIAPADMEAELHLCIVAVNNNIAERLGRKDVKMKLDQYLDMRGYNDKLRGVDLEGMRHG